MMSLVSCVLPSITAVASLDKSKSKSKLLPPAFTVYC